MTVCKRIADTYGSHRACKKVLEVGPGMGALTDFLLEEEMGLDVWVMDVDTESIEYLKENKPALQGKIIEADFLKTDLNNVMEGKPFAVVGNFPYNISTQIMFKCLEIEIKFLK